MHRVKLLGSGCFAIALTSGCSRSNNLFLGTVEATAGTHRIVVTDCYRLTVDPPREIKGAFGESGYRYTPCRDADVVIRQGGLNGSAEAIVNGRSYGRLNPQDSILVDHGAVSIGRAGTSK